MPKVSAIAVVQTAADLLPLQVSWDGQTFGDWERLVVGEAELLAMLTLARPWQPVPRRWVSWASAVNAGWKLAQGDYLAFWGRGDRWLPLLLTRLTQHLDRQPAVGIGFSRVGVTDRKGKLVGLYPLPPRADAATVLCHDPIPTPSCVLLRRSLGQELAFTANWYGQPDWFVWDERLPDFAAEDLWLRAACQTSWQLAAIPECLVQTGISTATAEIARQEAWETWLVKVATYAPQLLAEWEKPARAQRYCRIARQAQGALARQYVWRSLREHWPTVLGNGRNLRTVLRAWGLGFLCPPSPSPARLRDWENA